MIRLLSIVIRVQTPKKLLANWFTVHTSIFLVITPADGAIYIFCSVVLPFTIAYPFIGYFHVITFNSSRMKCG